MKAKKSKTVNTVNTTPAITPLAAKQHFIKTLAKSGEGENNHLDSFLRVMDAALALKPTFTISEIYPLAIPYEIPIGETRRLLELWTSEMLKMNKVSLIEGCYDDKIICQN